MTPRPFLEALLEKPRIIITMSIHGKLISVEEKSELASEVMRFHIFGAYLACVSVTCTFSSVCCGLPFLEICSLFPLGMTMKS